MLFYINNLASDFEKVDNYKDAIKFWEIGMRLIYSHSEYKNDINLVFNF